MVKTGGGMVKKGFKKSHGGKKGRMNAKKGFHPPYAGFAAMEWMK